MKRALLVLVLLSSLAGLGGALRWLPSALHARTERALAEALGAPVRVAEVGIGLRAGLALEGRGLETWDDEAGPALSAARVRIDLDASQLLLGGVHLDGVRLEGARARLGRDAGGRLRPEALARLAAPPDDDPGAAGETGPERLRRAVHALHRLTAPGLRVELAGAQVTWSEPAGDPLALAVDEARIALGSAPEDLAVTAAVRLDAAREAGSLVLAGWRDADATLVVELTTDGLDLGRLAASFPGALPAAIAGRLDGTARVRVAREAAPPPGAAHEPAPGLAPFPASVSLALRAEGLRLPPAAGAERGFGAREVRLSATLAAEPRRLRVERAALTADTLVLSASGSLGLPLGDDARAELALTLPRLGVARARELAALLPQRAARAAAAALAPIEAGEAAPLELAASAPAGRWRAVLSGRAQGVPPELELSARVQDAALRLAEGRRLEKLSGSVRLAGDRLDLRGVRGELAGERLPLLDASFQGVAALLAAERFAAPPPAPARIPAWPPLRRLLSRDPADPDRTPRWTGLRIDADLVHHPALLAPLEDAHAQLDPTPDGVHWLVEGARWGGVPIDAEGDWFDPPDERVVVSVRAVGERERPAGGAARPAPGDDWLRGRFSLGMAPPPRSRRLAAAEGWFRARGLELRLFETTARLAPGGVLRGELALDLASSVDVPFASRFTLSEGSVAGMRALFGAEDDVATGALEGQGELRGRLADGRPLFQDASGWARAVATDGELRGRLPLFVAIASASETLNPFAERDRIRYRRAEGELTLQDGRVSSDTISVDSPDLRLYLAGSVGVAPPHATEAVLGLFFFGKVSSMIGRVPILNRVLLGESESLAGAYFELAGPWGGPRASLVPLRSLAATGPAGFVLEGLPSFVRGGVDAIESLFRREAAGAPLPPAEPPDAGAAPPGPVGAAAPRGAEATP